MLWTIAAILTVLWILGLVSGASLGMWIHLFLMFAVTSFILALARQGRAA